MRKWLWLVLSFTVAAFFVTGCLTSAETYTDESKTINVSVGEEFTISLRVTPRLGERWEESHDENQLTLLESEIAMDKPSEPVSGNAVFLFKALEKGETKVTFTLGHGPTGPVRDQKTFVVQID